MPKRPIDRKTTDRGKELTMKEVIQIKSFKHEPERGSALLSAVVGLGMAGILMAVLATSFTNNMQALKLVEKKGELEDFRNYIRNTVNCGETFKSQACTSSVDLKSRKGSIMVSSNKTKFGKFELSSSCSFQSGMKKIDITVTHEAWKQSEQLFETVPFVCN